MSSETLPECVFCAACCFGPGARYVRVTGDDYERLGDAADALTRFEANRCYMRMHEGHCAALALHTDGSFACSIYAQRPSVCRELARGSRECRAELQLKGQESARALLRVVGR